MPEGSWQYKDIAPDAVWACPCGYNGDYQHVVSHRSGYRKRPACAGRIFEVSPGSGQAHPSGNPFRGAATPTSDMPHLDEPEGSPDGDAPQGQDPEPTDATQMGRPRAYDVLDDELARLGDPEEQARLLNARRGPIPGLPRDESWWNSLGGSKGDGGAGEPPGDGSDGGLPDGSWRLDVPRDPDVSVDKITVAVPIACVQMYDWARSQGWSQGAGTFSDFVADCLIDHFKNCWGHLIVVVRKDDVDVA